MELGISLYPEFMEEKLLHAYVERAASLGYSRIFLSLILNQLNFSGALPPNSKVFDNAFAVCKDHGMKITVDVDDEMLKGLGETDDAIACLRRRGVDCLRIDSGISEQLLNAAARQCLQIELNAANLDVSTPARLAEAEALMEKLFSHLAPQNIQGCFNFYPRTGTGLSLDYVARTTAFLHRHGIQAAAFVSSLSAKPVLHGPGRGVCTAEVLRDTPPEIAGSVLRCCGIDAVLFGDCYATEAELTALSEACAGESFFLPVVFHRDCPKALRQVLTHTDFANRCDSPEFVIRGTDTRGTAVEPFRTGPRPRFCVTVDNCRSAQYMGEMQIMLDDLPPCSEANVVGWIPPDAQILVPFLRDCSRRFRLTEYHI